MNDRYIHLFKELTRSMAVLAETVMEYNHKNDDTKGEETAQIMRDDYQNLNDKISEPGFDPQTLTRADFAKLLVGAVVVMQNIEERIKTEELAVQGYKIDTIPKLERVVNETDNDESALNLANQLFQITENDK